MADNHSDSRTHLSKTDAFIEDYLSDVWGDSHVLNKEEIEHKDESAVAAVSSEENYSGLSLGETVSAESNSYAESAAVPKINRVKAEVHSHTLQVKQVVRIPKNALLGGTPNLCVAPVELIQKQFSLVPTIKLCSDSQNQALRSQTESIIILLTNLYFLRRPLPPKVRLYILNLSEQVIDDYHAAIWLRGMSHEV